MSLEDEMIELSLAYHGQREHVEELEKKVTGLLQIVDELFELAPAGPTKNALWRRYHSLLVQEPSSEEARKVAEYNRSIDERNAINLANREKPWLPLHDGE